MQNTIALFGATGRTGKLFLAKALSAGYHVKALVRNAAKLDVKHTNLTLITGDVLNAADVKATIEGTTAVVSLFGHVKGSPEWVQTEGTQHMIDAMHHLGIKRIISLSGGGLPFPEKDQPKFADKLIRFIMKVAVPKILNDAIRHAEILGHSGLDWTIVRGPRLTDAEEKGQYKVGWVGVNSSTQISRADLASFILVTLAKQSFVRQMPFVSA